MVAPWWPFAPPTPAAGRDWAMQSTLSQQIMMVGVARRPFPEQALPCPRTRASFPECSGIPVPLEQLGRCRRSVAPPGMTAPTVAFPGDSQIPGPSAGTAFPSRPRTYNLEEILLFPRVITCAEVDQGRKPVFKAARRTNENLEKARGLALRARYVDLVGKTRRELAPRGIKSCMKGAGGRPQNPPAKSVLWGRSANPQHLRRHMGRGHAFYQ